MHRNDVIRDLILLLNVIYMGVGVGGGNSLSTLASASSISAHRDHLPQRVLEPVHECVEACAYDVPVDAHRRVALGNLEAVEVRQAVVAGVGIVEDAHLDGGAMMTTTQCRCCPGVPSST